MKQAQKATRWQLFLDHPVDHRPLRLAEVDNNVCVNPRVSQPATGMIAAY